MVCGVEPRGSVVLAFNGLRDEPCRSSPPVQDEPGSQSATGDDRGMLGPFCTGFTVWRRTDDP